MLNSVFQAMVYVAKIAPFVIGGLFLAELVIALKLIDRLSWITRPITDFGHLKSCCGLAFLSAFASPVAANSMLMGFYKEKKISANELVAAALINSFPASLMHWRWMLPAIIPVLKTTGLIYLGIFVIIGFIKSFAVLIVGKVIFPENNHDCVEKEKEKESYSLREAILVSARNTKKVSVRILGIILPVTVLVFILMDKGLFSALTVYFEKITKYFPLPAEGVPIIVTQFANSIAAFTLAGNLLSENLITSKGVILSLLVGGIFSHVLMLRILIPSYLGIFGRTLGIRVLALSFGLHVVITILAIFGLAIWWS